MSQAPRSGKAAPPTFSLAVKVVPGAPADRIMGFHERELVVKVRARACDGAANRALIDFLAATFGLPRSAFILKRGAASRHKLLALPLSCRAAIEAAGPVPK